MKPQSLFEFREYKAYLRDRILENKQVRGYQTQLAEAASCQPSFLSQVLHGSMDLSREHSAELCRFWDFDALQTEYFLALVDLSRAGSRYLKELVRARLEKIREDAHELKTRFRSEEVADAQVQALYYSSWYWSAIHLLVALPGFGTSQAIADRLALPLDLVKSALRKLEELGFIERTANGWLVGKRDIHLPDTSPLSEVNHEHWLRRATLSVQKGEKDAYHYTSVFTMGREDAAKVKEMIRNAVMKAREAIGPSPNEELYCFTSDFFRV